MASRSSRNVSNRTEILVGRSLAACTHPLAAWRSQVRSFRVLLLAGYFAMGYVSVLVTMVYLH